MDRDIEILTLLYDRFNARDIDGVLGALAEDVAWANGMDGGHVHGREELREYWTRQWAIVSPHVEPVGFRRADDGAIVADVRQTVRDLEGRPLEDQTHGLHDKTVGHVFHLQDSKVVRFDIASGSVTARWGSAGTGPGQFLVPHGVADFRIGAVLGRDVVVVGQRRTAEFLDLLDDRVGHRLPGAGAVAGPTEVVDHHAGTFARQQQRVLAAQATARARDDDDSAVESRHVPGLPFE